MNMFTKHRAALMRRLPDGLILLSGGREVPRNSDVCYVFRQNSDFLYLTGIEEPGFHLLLDPKRRTSVLFIPRIDDKHRVWQGHIPGPAEARRLYGVPQVRYADALPAVLKKRRKGYRKCYADKAAWKTCRPALRGLKSGPSGLSQGLQELRAVKTPGEVALIRQASKISSRAHTAAMRAARPGMREYEVQAVFESECRRAGLRHQAYPSIVAAGTNSAVLHYVRNDAALKSGDLLLIDAGAEARGYAADITRTFPVSRRFTRRQRDIYSIVLETQKACIGKARAGVTSAELHLHSAKLIAQGLRDLKLMRGNADGLVESGAVRLFYPHGLGHMLGLDVHDPDGGRKRKISIPANLPLRFASRLEPGFVMTVEPGIYFMRALLGDPKRRRKFRTSIDFARADSYLNFGGIRIEDNIVIRRGAAPHNLTAAAKEIAAIEELRRRG
ncbi:MAG: aminopeptidase P family protein [Elusimicrobiota bacterium]